MEGLSYACIWNPEIPCCVHKAPLFICILSQINPFQVFASNFFNIPCNKLSNLCLGTYESIFFHEDFWQFLHVFLISRLDGPGIEFRSVVVFHSPVLFSRDMMIIRGDMKKMYKCSTGIEWGRLKEAMKHVNRWFGDSNWAPCQQKWVSLLVTSKYW